MSKNYILGLDVGVNSLGAALVQCKIEKKANNEGKTEKEYIPQKLITLYSRIFQEMVDAKTGVPKNVKRRTMRGARRRLSRLRHRRDDLIEFFQKKGLLPKEINEDTMNKIAQDFAGRVSKDAVASKRDIDDRYKASPLFMRVYGLDGKLKPYEFGCALLQIQKRRGYKSNRGAKYNELFEYLEKTEGPPPQDLAEVEKEKEQEELKGDTDKTEDKEAAEKRKETQVVNQGIGTLRQAIKEAKCRSLAEFICQQAEKEKGALQRITRYSYESEKTKDGQKSEFNFYAERKMYFDEFDTLWEKQSKNLKLSKEDKEKVEKIIFYQRPLLNPPPQAMRLPHLRYNDVGSCSFFPKKKRAAKALLICQDYRTWQVINNLKVEESKHEIRPLTQEEKEKVYALSNDSKEVNANYTLSFAKVSKLLGLTGKLNYDNARSAEGDSQLIGNRTAFQIRQIIRDEKWDALQQEGQEQLVQDILDFQSKRALYKKLVSHWKLSSGWGETALQLATLELEPGHMKHCVKAVREILNCMKTHGTNYYESCEKLKYHDLSSPHEGKPRLDEQDIPSLANPRVQKALFQIRQVINAIIDKHGKPAVIRLELARDLKASKEHRSRILKMQTWQRKNNIEAEQELKKIMDSEKKYDSLATHTKLGLSYFTREDRSKFKMWKQQIHQCLYCFKTISCNDLIDGGAEIDHILPQTGFRQNFMNTVLACKTCNQEKGGKTPYEAWGGTDKWARIENELEYIKKEGKRETCKQFPEVPVMKIKRILLNKYNPAEDRDFVQSQLNDTRYIARSIKQILSVLGVKIRITKGGGAAILRDLWGFDSILPRHPDDDINYEIINRRTGELVKEGKFTPGESSEHTANLKKDELIRPVHKDEKNIAGIKNRQDHRHHALDAFVAALTDQGMLMHLTSLNRIQNKDGDAYKKGKKKIRQPEGWEGDKVIQKDVQKAAMDLVVSHERKDKIYGALHEETCYGKACYHTEEEISTSAASIRRLKEYLETDRNAKGKIIWILREKEREAIRQWLAKLDILTPKEKKDFPLPKIDDKPVQKIVLAHRCYVVRKPLAKETLKYAEKSWENKDGTWIMDKEVHQQISEWLKKGHKEEDLIKNPPRMKSKNGLGHPIKSIRLGMHKGEESITETRGGQVFELGSNHHVELFSNGKEGADREIKSRIVSMKDAALRKSKKTSIINKKPSLKWSGKWTFWMTLRINDMVLWDEEDKRVEKHKLLGKPIYRLQKMSGQISVFRHHSVATSNDNHGKIQANWNTLSCQKINLNVLGVPVSDK